jgi:RNA polymerase sigma factor (sigma-70 family)
MKRVENMSSKEFQEMFNTLVRVAMYNGLEQDDAKDVVGNVFEKLITGKFERYESNDLLYVLKRAVRNAAIDMYRSASSRARKNALTNWAEIHAVNMKDDFSNDMNDTDDKLKRLELALSKLKPEQAELLKLKYAEGRSYEELVPRFGGNARSLCVKTGRICEQVKRSIGF